MPVPSVPVSVRDARPVVDQVDVAEVSVVVVSAAVVAVVGRVARPGRARLLVRVAVRADDERSVVLVVEPVVAALACNSNDYKLYQQRPNHIYTTKLVVNYL